MQIKRVNKFCAYYPCHKGLEDCTFCFCPFYPCLDENLGEYITSKKGAQKKIWSCQKCSWVHKKNVTERFLNLIRKRNQKFYINAVR